MFGQIYLEGQVRGPAVSRCRRHEVPGRKKSTGLRSQGKSTGLWSQGKSTGLWSQGKSTGLWSQGKGSAVSRCQRDEVPGLEAR